MADVGGVLPLVALWAHGSLELGDFRPGRSDLDLVALTGTTLARAGAGAAAGARSAAEPGPAGHRENAYLRLSAAGEY